MANGAGHVARILYKEIVPGDLRKILAQSNDSDTGGGARDFRFGSFKTLLPVITEMFPKKTKENRKRDGVVEEIDVFQGEFFWHDVSGQVMRKDSFFETPTDVRPSEGRIARVHEYGCFDTSLVPRGGVGNRILLLLIQLSDGSVWPYYVEEKTLRIEGKWDPVVAAELLGCLDAKRAANRAVIGYRDFTNAGKYCNGK
ncbi:TPA: hypothetical protein VDV84_001425 [Pseudomonas aeruginosa]|uniref:hypothetical protein n=1 Tax=Pseudomonas shirazica TaxID=1940636 RepID=UPI002D7B83E9|nr:hypothetical protein [Pseudomonas aeruginosa]HBO2582757.1 hypothetical protein [Pseudomonas aeruginosa]HBO2601229.1 hypothetical protein [Pseudomonas aeruginosa]HEP7918005.1 hypothetical protein [Pseudomonas aeruginosa]HEP8246551.1 hypothetical protein [Pseudomonas aeruginosa]